MRHLSTTNPEKSIDAISYSSLMKYEKLEFDSNNTTKSSIEAGTAFTYGQSFEESLKKGSPTGNQKIFTDLDLAIQNAKDTQINFNGSSVLMGRILKQPCTHNRRLYGTYNDINISGTPDIITTVYCKLICIEVKTTISPVYNLESILNTIFTFRYHWQWWFYNRLILQNYNKQAEFIWLISSKQYPYACTALQPSQYIKDIANTETTTKILQLSKIFNPSLCM